VAAREVNFTRATGADTAIKDIDAAIQAVSSARGDLGALQNRFEHTINNLNVTVENLSASESRIRDADMAQEMMQFTRTRSSRRPAPPCWLRRTRVRRACCPCSASSSPGPKGRGELALTPPFRILTGTSRSTSTL
jgi:hypothetical protein